MTVSKKISRKIRRMIQGKTFGYADLQLQAKEYSSAIKVLSRLVKSGKINRIKPGVFYKPEETIFGSLTPKESEILKLYLFNGNKRVAYVTGISLYNRMGLTTQVPNVIQIASLQRKDTTKVETLKFTSVKSYVEVSEKNVKLLRLSDVIKDFDKIPDGDNIQIINFLKKNIKKLNDKEIQLMVDISTKYPPRVTALLGAILETLNYKKFLEKLKLSINPVSEYFFGIKENELKTINNWNIY